MPPTTNCCTATIPPLLTEIETILLPSDQDDASFWLWTRDGNVACPPVEFHEKRLLIRLGGTSPDSCLRHDAQTQHHICNNRTTPLPFRRDENGFLVKSNRSRSAKIVNIEKSFKELDEIVTNASSRCPTTTEQALTIEDEKKDEPAAEDNEFTTEWKSRLPITLSEQAAAAWIQMSEPSSSGWPSLTAASIKENHLSTEIIQTSSLKPSTTTDSYDALEHQQGYNASDPNGQGYPFRDLACTRSGSPKPLISLSSMDNNAKSQVFTSSFGCTRKNSSFYQPFACLIQSLGYRHCKESFPSSHDLDGTEHSQRTAPARVTSLETGTSKSRVGGSRTVEVSKPNNLAPNELLSWKSGRRCFTVGQGGKTSESERQQGKDCLRPPLAQWSASKLHRHVQQKLRNSWGKKNEMVADAAEKALWKTAVDPRSGRTYYYHVKTRETQWRKPAVLATPEERQVMEEKEQQQREFFAAMEANILRSITQGAFSGSGSSEGLDLQRTSPPQPSPRDFRENDSRIDITPGSPKEAPPLGFPRSSLVRTISAMEESALVNLIQRVPSNRNLWPPAAGSPNGQQDIIFTPQANDARKASNDHERAPAPLLLTQHAASSSRAFSSSSRRSLTSIDEKNQASAETLLRGLSVRSRSEDSSDDGARVFGEFVDPDENGIARDAFWLAHEYDNESNGTTCAVQSASLDRQRSFGTLLADLPKEGTESMRSLYGASGLDESNMNFQIDAEESQALEDLAKVTDQMSQVLEDEPFDKQEFRFLSEITEDEGGEESTTDRSDSDFASKYELAFVPARAEEGRGTHTRMSRNGSECSAPSETAARGYTPPAALTEDAGTTPLPTRTSVRNPSFTLQDAEFTPAPTRASIREPSFTLQGDAGVTPLTSKLTKASLIEEDDDDDASPALRPPIPRAHSLRGPEQPETPAKPAMTRRNTCGTLYVGSTMASPDQDATIKCVCAVYRAHIIQSMNTNGRPNPKYRAFNDLESQQKVSILPRRSKADFAIETEPPTLDEITTFYRDVFQRAQMEPDCIIISLIYVERLMKATKGGLLPRPENWRSILFSCMVLSSKVWDDLSMWNGDFSQTCPAGVKFPLRRVNELEVAVLSSLNYQVKVPASEYAKYYFLLRSMLIKSGLSSDEFKATNPLDVEGARRLQHVSAIYQTTALKGGKEGLRKLVAFRSKSVGSQSQDKTLLPLKGKAALEYIVKM